MKKLLICAALAVLIATPAMAQNGKVTPAAGSVTAITTGGTAVTVLTGPANGCYIANPLSATDQGIGAAEPLFINPVTTATTTANISTIAIPAGTTWPCPFMSTLPISVNAVTSAHKFTVVRW